jgi:hypothetical protein
MADGIRIQDAALEISPSGLEALVNNQGAEVRVTKLDLAVSPEALNTLLRKFAPEGTAAPSATLGDGRVQVSAQQGGKTMGLDLSVGSLRVEITAAGIRLVSG